jgi:uncharacterized protein YndB with AHSA1/START domain
MAKQKEIHQLASVTNDALKKATGKSWTSWINSLDRKKADTLSHPEIVKLLAPKIESPWWRQKIALGFREAKGKRITGQIAGGFQIGARRVFPLSKDDAWDFLLSPEAMKIWLGKALALDGARSYKVKKGLAAEMRVFKPGSHLRMAWHPDKWISPSLLQVRVVASGKKTALSFHHEGLPSETAREEMKAHWTTILDKLEKLFETR